MNIYTEKPVIPAQETVSQFSAAAASPDAV
jgi:hypothetical protein